MDRSRWKPQFIHDFSLSLNRWARLRSFPYEESKLILHKMITYPGRHLEVSILFSGEHNSDCMLLKLSVMILKSLYTSPLFHSSLEPPQYAYCLFSVFEVTCISSMWKNRRIAQFFLHSWQYLGNTHCPKCHNIRCTLFESEVEWLCIITPQESYKKNLKLKLKKLTSGPSRISKMFLIYSNPSEGCLYQEFPR